jgi:hypothetical protein
MFTWKSSRSEQEACPEHQQSAYKPPAAVTNEPEELPQLAMAPLAVIVTAMLAAGNRLGAYLLPHVSMIKILSAADSSVPTMPPNVHR